MAQIVDYFADEVSYDEGPFVAVDAHGWRVEVEYKGTDHPCLPHSSIYQLLRREKMYDGKESSGQSGLKKVSAAVDWLNQLVRDGEIRLWNPQGGDSQSTECYGIWIYPPLARETW